MRSPTPLAIAHYEEAEKTNEGKRIRAVTNYGAIWELQA